jgi:hypothetical protein
MSDTTLNTRPSTIDGGRWRSCGRATRLAFICVAVALVAVLVLVALVDLADILKGVGLDDGQDSVEDQDGSFESLESAITEIRGPATVAVGSVGGLGVAGGAAMMAFGSPKGMKIMGSSAGALAALGVGNGFIE